MEESISQNAGKVLLDIYLTWKKEGDVSNFKKLLEVTKLEEYKLKRSLKYCCEKQFIDLEITYGIGIRRMDGEFWIKDITAIGIDIIENPQNKNDSGPFNVTFNFNNDFNIDSIIKGEVKLF